MGILRLGRLSWGVAMSQPDLFRMLRKPWNAGRLTGAKALLKPKHNLWGRLVSRIELPSEAR